MNSETVAKDREIARLKSQNAVLGENYRQALNELAVAETRAEALLGLQSDPNPRDWERISKKPSRHSTAILCLNDLHIEERVDKDVVGGINEYNPKIAEARLKRVTEKALYLIDFWSHISKIDEIVVWLGGDIITGYIHDELKESNYLSPTEATLLAQDLLLTALQTIQKESKVKRIVVPTSLGNHSRTTLKPRTSTYYKNSYEWLLYHNLAKHLPKVQFKIEKSYHNVVKIKDKVVRFSHGDYIKYLGGSGGLTIPAMKALGQWNKQLKADLDVTAHYHQFIDTWNWVSCGCLIGPTAYSISIKADYQPPTQTMIIIDSKYGKVAAMPIFCQ